MSFRRVLSDVFEEVMSQTRMPPPPTIYSPEDRPRRLDPDPVMPPEFEPEERPRLAPREEIIDDLVVRRPQPVVVTEIGRVTPRGTGRAEIRAALSSPAGIRQALILQEIIGPPKALRPPDDDMRG